MILDDLKPGKYKGAVFFIRSSSIDGGHKDAKHEFPGSDLQSIEFLGTKPKIYNLSVYIAAPDYFQKRDALIRALDEESAGVLSHPFYGDIENIVSRNYTISEDITNLGEANLTILFEINDDTGEPKADLNVSSNIKALNGSLSDSIGLNIADGFEVDNNFLNNFKGARQKLLNLNNTVREKTSFVFKAIEAGNEFNALLTDFEDNINELITKPAQLGNTIVGIFDSINGLYTNVKDAFDVYGSFNDFGDDDVVLNITTVGLQQRQSNNDIINDSVKVLSLGYEYQNAVELEFTSVEEIDELEADVETNYQNVVDGAGISPETLEILKDVRNATSNFFQEERLTVDKTIVVNTQLTSSRLLAYQYYADSSIGEDIALLNDLPDVTFIKGDVRIFTE